ncbi:LysE family translocator [Leucobacter zeae]|nr:LysE family translocator [Leucobacter zeae]
MSFEQAVLGFAVVALLLTLIPGVDTAIVLRSAVSRSRPYAWAVAFGVLTGTVVWGVAAAVGASALLAASETAYRIMSLAGAAYLAWMGVRFVARSFRTAVDDPGRIPELGGDPWRGFGIGVLTNLLNPKVGVFYLAAIPQFMPADASPIGMGIVLALVHNAFGLVWFALLILAGGALGAKLRSPRFLRWLDRVTGGVLILFGVRMALELRNA